MHICLVVEGCYPYIVGGVSSWVQSLISNCPEHEFSIIAINPNKDKRGKFKYDIPPNVREIQEVFLDELMERKGKWNKKIKIKKEEKETIINLLDGKKIDWHILFDFFKNKRFNSTDLLLSKDFYNIIQDSYGEMYSHIPFTDVFWTLRSMYITLFALIENTYVDADLYHSVSTGYAGIVGSVAAYTYKKPLILTEHGIYTREREEEIIKSDWVAGQFKSIWINYFKNLSDAIYDDASVVISLFEKNAGIQVELGCDEKKIEIIHNGIKKDHFSKVCKIKKNTEDKIVVGAIVRVVPIKDIITMLQAFKIVESQVENVEFLIIGPSDENEEYFEECIKYKENLQLKNITFTGRVKVDEFIGNIDIHVLSSISEGQPLTVLETLAMKIPNVTTNVGDCPSMIYGVNSSDDYGKAGEIVNIMDFKGLAREVIKLAKNPQLRKKYGENGYNRVINEYTFEMFINAYKIMYTNLGE